MLTPTNRNDVYVYKYWFPKKLLKETRFLLFHAKYNLGTLTEQEIVPRKSNIHYFSSGFLGEIEGKRNGRKA